MRKAASRKASGNFASDLPLLEVSTGQEDGGNGGQAFPLGGGTSGGGKDCVGGNTRERFNWHPGPGSSDED